MDLVTGDKLDLVTDDKLDVEFLLVTKIYLEKLLETGKDFVKENRLDLLENRWVKWMEFAKEYSMVDLLEERLETGKDFVKEN